MVFSWEMAEELAAAHMRELGFVDAQRTPAGTDRGLDVIASGAVAQVKHLQVPVGAPDVQRFRGAAYNYGGALFYSSSGYTRAAIEAAEAMGVALFVVDSTNQVSAVNEHAAVLRPPRQATELDRVRALFEKDLDRAMLRNRSWARALRRRSDGSYRQGTGRDPDPRQLELVGLVTHTPAEVSAERVESSRQKVLEIGLALGDYRSAIRQSQSAERDDELLLRFPDLKQNPDFNQAEHVDFDQLQRDLTARSGDLDEFEAQMVAWFVDRQGLAQIVRREVRLWKAEAPDWYGTFPDDVCFPG